MNPVFVILVCMAGFLIWLLGSFLYRPIGKLVKGLFWKAQDAMDKDEEEIEIEEIIRRETEE